MSCNTNAQIATDGSLGTQTNLSGPDFTITQSLGQQRGQNLFHSFAVFNVAAGESASFLSDASINNIIARITGGGGTTIDGSLIAGSNLFLINPAGLVVTQNAALNINGDLHLSTADYLRLDDDSRFFADLNGNTTLTVANPAAFGFLDADIAPLDISNATLNITDTYSLTLSGGDISIDQSQINAQGGGINIAAAASAGEISLTAGGIDTSALSTLADISVQNSRLSVTGDNTGDIVIRGGRIMMTTGADIHSQTTARGGDIDIEAQSLSLTDGSSIANGAMGAGNGGNIYIATNSLSLATGAQIRSGISRGAVAAGESLGRGGNIVIDANSMTLLSGGIVSSDTIAINGESGDAGTIDIDVDTLRIDADGTNITTGITSNTDALFASDNAGRGGQITITASDIELGTLGTIEANTLSRSDAGTVDIIADSLRIAGQGAGISSASLSLQDNAGSGNRVSITAGTIDVTDRGFIGIQTQSSGNAGQLIINADTFSLSDRGSIQATTFVTSGPAGDGGNIVIEAGEVNLTNLGAIFATTEGEGLGGSVQIITDALNLDSSFILADTNGSGAAGAIRINATDIDLRNASRITASTHGAMANAGAAGNITIAASRLNLADRSGIANASRGTGDSGQITLNVDAIELARQSAIVVSSSSLGGDVGNITINGSTLALNGGSAILAENHGPDLPGAITINTAALHLAEQSRISSLSSGSGRAGNVFVDATDEIRLTNGSQITTEARTAGGGNITLFADNLLYLDNSEITTTGLLGAADGGNIFIDPILVVVVDSNILAQAFTGSGGNIDIIGDYIFVVGDGVIDASSNLGIDGQVGIAELDADLKPKIERLRPDFLDAAQWVSEPCGSRVDYAGNRLVVAGRQGAYVAPTDLAASSYFDVAQTGDANENDNLAAGDWLASVEPWHANTLVDCAYHRVTGD